MGHSRTTIRPLRAAALGDPQSLLEEFKAGLHRLEGSLDPSRIDSIRQILLRPSLYDPTSYQLEETNKAQRAAYRAYLEVKDLPLHKIGHTLFLALLQTFTLPPRLRKRVEEGSKEYTKSRAPSVSNQNKFLSALSIYEKTIAQARQYVEVATEALRVGVPHIEEGEGATQVRVGPFRLLNLGGFDQKVVSETVKILEDTIRRINRVGLGKVLYGDIHLTNTLMKNTLAFYLYDKDELFLRANLTLNAEVALSLLHELGHRYDNKFLPNREAVLKTLYRTIKSQPPSREELDPPQPGEQLDVSGISFKVVRVVSESGEGQVILQPIDSPGPLMKITLRGWRKRKGLPVPSRHSFVTPYAKTSPEENFAEMFAHYVGGSLPTDQTLLFEEILGR